MVTQSCTYCGHALKDHCKGNVSHQHYKDEMKQAGPAGQHRMSTCKARHCEVAMCDCLDFKAAAKIRPAPRPKEVA